MRGRRRFEGREDLGLIKRGGEGGGSGETDGQVSSICAWKLYIPQGDKSHGFGKNDQFIMYIL